MRFIPPHHYYGDLRNLFEVFGLNRVGACDIVPLFDHKGIFLLLRRDTHHVAVTTSLQAQTYISLYPSCDPCVLGAAKSEHPIKDLILSTKNTSRVKNCRLVVECLSETFVQS
jgi:hypothetical protein